MFKLLKNILIIKKIWKIKSLTQKNISLTQKCKIWFFVDFIRFINFKNYFNFDCVRVNTFCVRIFKILNENLI